MKVLSVWSVLDSNPITRNNYTRFDFATKATAKAALPILQGRMNDLRAKCGPPITLTIERVTVSFLLESEDLKDL